MGRAENAEESASNENCKFKDGVNRNARLIVRNVSFKATEELLRDHFAQYGTVEEVKLLKRPDGKLVGCGFVHFTQVPMANKALTATNKKLFLGRPLSVGWSVSKDKYTEKIANGAPKKRLNSTSSNESKVSVKEKEDNPKEAKDKNTIRLNRKSRLIIRNISFKATEETLKQHFESYGEVIEVKLLKKPNGKLVGCAFVQFKNVPMAKAALLNTNMKPFLGRPISVDWAVAKDKYMQHTISQQIELEDQIKKEDSSDEDEDEKPTSQELKAEVKSEDGSIKSEDESEDGDSDDNASSDDDNDDDDEEEGDENSEDDDVKDDQQSVTSTQPDRLRIKLNDAEDGCTVFLTNIPFSVDNDQLKAFAETTGPVKYALVCVDKMTEHSKGTGFVKFVNNEDLDKFLSLTPEELKLEGQVLVAKPALKRENLQKGDKKQAKDNRNLYLVKEGVIVAGTRAAVGLSASDMTKRLALERSKTQMLRNLNRFVSRYRLVVSNLPPHVDDTRLRRLVTTTAPRDAVITEVRVMRDLRAGPGKDGRAPSKGYGFVMFMRHEDALACLRKLNNNPDVFDKNNRPIVSFSIEDRTALNARKKRLEKSIANNPLANKGEHSEAKGKRNRKRKINAPPDESYVKKGRFDNKKNEKQFEAGKFVKNPSETEYGEYTGLTSKQGSEHKIRNNHKLKSQAEIHRQTVKSEKKNSSRSWRLKMAAKERIKQPKQKINKNKNNGKRRRFKRDKSAL